MEHLPGQHDQSTHGAWSSGSSFHDPSKHVKGAARSAKLAAAKLAKQGDGGKGSQAVGTLFPTSSQLATADLHQFGSSYNTTYKTTIDGQDYFVKQSTSPQYDPVEVGAYTAGKELGLEEHLVPLAQVKAGEQTYQVAPWTEGKPLVEYSSAGEKSIMDKLSPETFTKMAANEYLMNDGDRHAGNYLVDGHDNLRIIDMGFALRWAGTTYTGTSMRGAITGSSKLLSGYAKAKGTAIGKLTFEKSASLDVLSHEENVLTIFKPMAGADNFKGLVVNPWTSQDTNSSVYLPDQLLDAIAWSGHQFVAVGDKGTILTSYDGIIWARQNSNQIRSSDARTDGAERATRNDAMSKVIPHVSGQGPRSFQRKKVECA